MTPTTDLIARLRIKSAMMNMGEKIAWGSDTALMDEAADALAAQEAELANVTREWVATAADGNAWQDRARAAEARADAAEEKLRLIEEGKK